MVDETRRSIATAGDRRIRTTSVSPVISGTYSSLLSVAPLSQENTSQVFIQRWPPEPASLKMLRAQSHSLRRKRRVRFWPLESKLKTWPTLSCLTYNIFRTPKPILTTKKLQYYAKLKHQEKHL